MAESVFDRAAVVLPIPVYGKFGAGEVDALRRQNLELRRMLAAIVKSQGQARLKLPFAHLRRLSDPQTGLLIEKSESEHCWFLRVGLLADAGGETETKEA